MKRFLGVLAVILFLAGIVSAQEDRGRISGVVTDPTGAVIPKANVLLTSETTGVQLTTVSNGEGAFSFDLLISGLYTVQVDVAGFKKYALEHIRIQSGSRIGVPVKLEVGKLDNSITVTATNAIELKTEDAMIGYTVETRSVEELPYIGLADLQWLTPGVASTTLTNGSGAESTSISGVPSGRTEFTLNGAPNSRNGGSVTVAFTPAEKMVDEFHITTSPYDASLAHTAGGSLDISLKSGSSKYHGSVYGKYENPNVNAPQFSQSSATAPADRYDSENANFGGPILARKLFFFSGYQRTHKVSAASTSTMTVPTANEVNGDFSALLAVGTNVTTTYTCPSTKAKITTAAYNSYQIYNPYSTRVDPNCPGMYVRDPIAGNIITNAHAIDPIAARILKYYPAPTGSATQTASGANNFVSTAANLTNSWQEVNRIDYTLSNTQKLFGHFLIGTNSQPGKSRYFPGASGKTTTTRNKAALLDYVNTLSARTLLNVRYSITRFTSTTTIDSDTNATALGINANATAGIPAKFLGFPYVAFSDGFATLGSADPGYEGDTIHDGQINLSHSYGRHQVKVGAQWRRYQANQADYTNAKLYIGSKNTYSKGPSSASSGSAIGQALAEFQMGLTESTKETVPAATANNTNYWTGYVQDDWKVTPHLTFNVGVRYEYFGAIQERNGKSITYLDTTVQSPIAATVMANYAASATSTELATLPVSAFSVNGGLRFAAPGQQVWNPQRNNFSPRFGFSFNPIPKLVARGGFGIFYQHIAEYQQYARPDGFSQTTNTTTSNDNGLTFVGTLANPFPNGLNAATGSSQGLYQDIGTSISQWFIQNPKSPLSYHFSLGVQYALPGDFMLEADYVGNLAQHQRITRDWDAVPNKYLSTDPTRTTAQTALNTALGVSYTNPFYGVTVPVSQSLFTGTTTTLSQLLRPYPQYTGISGSDMAGTGSYNSLQVMLQKRFTHGYNMSLMYTWSRTLDALTFLNAADAKPWYGTSNTDYPQILSLASIYELPFGRGKMFLSNAPHWLQQTLGFQVEGTYRIQAGQPLSFSADSVLASGKTFADINGSSKHNTQQWFNTDAFANILTNANYANDTKLVSHVRTFPLRFNNVRQDYQNMLNLGAMKKFDFSVAGTKVNAKFRADAFNAMNHQVFTNPTTDPGSTSFGKISGPGNSSRYLMFGIQADF